MSAPAIDGAGADDSAQSSPGRRANLTNSSWTFWVKTIAVVVSGFCLASCSNNSSTIPEAEYSTKIVGAWQDTVGDQKETMSINGDGTFVCRVQSTGFIARTLSQGLSGTVYGTWKITGAIITLTISGVENESLTKERITSSTIVALKEEELVLKSDGGETAPFQRVRS